METELILRAAQSVEAYMSDLLEAGLDTQTVLVYGLTHLHESTRGYQDNAFIAAQALKHAAKSLHLDRASQEASGNSAKVKK